MSTPLQLGGIAIDTPILLEKLEPTTPAPAHHTNVVPEPLANVIEMGDKYHVNIFAYLPDNLIDLEHVESAAKVSNKIWLQYNGLANIPTPIPNQPSGTVLCRTFEVVFESQEEATKYPNLYRISFNYSVRAHSVNAEAIFVLSENLDPKTSRGTITTVRR